MLKGISPLLSPDLLYAIAAMGHGDDLVIGDCNFPADSMGKRCIRADGVNATDLLDAILTHFPLDTYVAEPFTLMQTEPNFGDPPIWNEYRKIIDKHEQNVKIRHVERFAFYEEAKKAYATVATTEMSLYACLIIKKGVLI